MTARRAPAAPGHLRSDTQAWYRRTMQQYALEEHHQRMLVMACEHFDRARAAREELEKHGLIYTDRFGQPRPRPEAAIARDSAIACARLLREIGLDADIPSLDPRLPRRFR